MKKIASSLTNPEEKDIRGYVEYHEEEWGFGDSIYMLCVDALREKNPCDIKEKDVKGPIQTFLVNWGMIANLRMKFRGIARNFKNSEIWTWKTMI